MQSAIIWALLLLGVAMISVAVVRYPSEEDVRRSIRDTEGDDAYQLRVDIDRRSDIRTSLCLAALECFSLAILVGAL